MISITGAPVRVEHPVDHFSVDYVRPNHSLVDRIRVLLPLADGHLFKDLLRSDSSLALINLSFHYSPSPNCDWTHVPTSRSSCRRRGRGGPEDHSESDKTLLGFLPTSMYLVINLPTCWKWDNFARFSTTSPYLVMNLPTCDHSCHTVRKSLCECRLQ